MREWRSAHDAHIISRADLRSQQARAVIEDHEHTIIRLMSVEWMRQLERRANEAPSDLLRAVMLAATNSLFDAYETFLDSRAGNLFVKRQFGIKERVAKTKTPIRTIAASFLGEDADTFSG